MSRTTLFLTIASFFSTLVALIIIVGNHAPQTQAATNQVPLTHIMISQIQTDGYNSTLQSEKEFIELYNPTNSAINLYHWKVKRIGPYRSENRVITAIFDPSNLCAECGVENSYIIPPHGYFLIGTGLQDEIALDFAYLPFTVTDIPVLTDDAAYAVYDPTDTLVDLVGMGNALDSETTTTQNPPAGQSVIRKASQGSTAESLSPGGIEAAAGNGYDTNNNSNDFVLLTSPILRNSKSPQAPPIDTTITPTPSESQRPISLVCTIQNRTWTILGKTFTLPKRTCKVQNTLH